MGGGRGLRDGAGRRAAPAAAVAAAAATQGAQGGSGEQVCIPQQATRWSAASVIPGITLAACRARALTLSGSAADWQQAAGVGIHGKVRAAPAAAGLPPLLAAAAAAAGGEPGIGRGAGGGRLGGHKRQQVAAVVRLLLGLARELPKPKPKPLLLLLLLQVLPCQRCRSCCEGGQLADGSGGHPAAAEVGTSKAQVKRGGNQQVSKSCVIGTRPACTQPSHTTHPHPHAHLNSRPANSVGCAGASCGRP